MTIFRSAQDAYTVGAPIVRLLVTALGRTPHAPELQSAVQAARRGQSLEQLAQSLVGGAEFHSRHGPSGPPDSHYLLALFWAVDGENPSPEDAALLAPLATRTSVLLAVSQSRRAQDGISLVDNLYPDGLPPEDDVAYQLWLDANPPAGAAARVRHAATVDGPLFSLILTVPIARPDLVDETVASLSAQFYPRWECLLVCPSTLPPHVLTAVQALANRVAAVRLIDVPAGLSAAEGANLALTAATGAMVGWLEASDRLVPSALYEAAIVLAGNPTARLIYTDEDCIAGDGTRFSPALKPGWSPDLALTGDSLGQLVLLDRQVAQDQGGFSAGAAPFERYDLVLRVSHDAPLGSVHHIPAILFHRGRQRGRPARFPQARAIATEPALAQIVSRHLARHHPGLTLGERLYGTGMWPTLAAALPQPAPRVSVIVPTRDGAALLERCLDGLLTRTDYPDIEVLVMDNGSKDIEALELLQRVQHDSRVKVLSRPGPFNWSALNNDGAAAASGEILVLLNNDIEVIEPGWLAALAGHATRPDVGVVGARLLFPDGLLQHGGMLLGPQTEAVHAMTYAADGQAGYLGQVTLPRDLSAVTGACLAIRRSVFDQVGGLETQSMRVTWSDVDLCLKVRRAGFRVLWLPDVVLTHREMATRGRDVTWELQARHEYERAALRRRWPVGTNRDPFLNPNLEATVLSLVLAQPPRRVPPWPRAEEDAA
jgi:GT2 family glycosyltransferase